jgi:acetyltransferase-like isoleucine patch superfamily enzyme
MISIGNNCFIGVGSNFYAWNERIIIGNNVMIAAGVRMITRKHGFADLQIPMTEQGYTNAPIFIEDNVWIGFNAILLPGIRVGEGSIIGAGAIVTRDVEDHTIVGGIPARLIRHRFPKGK